MGDDWLEASLEELTVFLKSGEPIDLKTEQIYTPDIDPRKYA